MVSDSTPPHSQSWSALLLHPEQKLSSLTREQNNGRLMTGVSNCFTTGGLGPRGPPQQLRECAALAQDLSSVTRTHTGWFTTAWNANCRESTVESGLWCVYAGVILNTEHRYFLLLLKDKSTKQNSLVLV